MIALMVQLNNEAAKADFSRRLHIAMDNAGYEVRGRARKLASQFSVSDKGAGKWLNGEAIPETHRISAIASWLGVSGEWLLTGSSSNNDIHSNVEAAPRLKGLVPLINEVQAGAWTDIKTGFDESEISEWIPTAKANSRYSFALRVVGDSMFDPYEKRSLNEGMIVIVDPEKPAQHRSMVVARLANSDKATVKELVIDGDSKFLRPFNRQYAIINVTESVVIIGVVVGAFSSFI